MEVILSKMCLSLSGCLGRGYGYFIVKRKERFYSQRSKHSVPPDGHWRFIVLCAELAKNGLHITDINISWFELQSALKEAHHFIAAQVVHDNYWKKDITTYNATDIINLKIAFGL